MPTFIGREAVQRLVAEGAQLVDVLPKASFDEWHLPAIHLPLRKMDARAGSALDRLRPVVVYCGDSI